MSTDWIEAAAKEILRRMVRTDPSRTGDEMTTPQRWRIAVKDPEWRWVPSFDDKAVPYEWKLHDSAEHDLRNFCERYKIPSVIVAGPPFVLPTEPQAVQVRDPVCRTDCGDGSTIWDTRPRPGSLCDPGTPAPRPSPQPVDIDALQKLYDASTPGEWGPSDDMVVTPPNEERTRKMEAGEYPFTCRRVARCEESYYTPAPENLANVAFIAASHNAMPQLLAEVREMREEVLWWANAPAGAAMNEKNSQLAAAQEREKRMREILKRTFPYVRTECPHHAELSALAKE